MGHKVIKIHYQAELDLEVEIFHNSSQQEDTIADNLKKLIDESLFLQGPLDTNINSFVMNQ